MTPRPERMTITRPDRDAVADEALDAAVERFRWAYDEWAKEKDPRPAAVDAFQWTLRTLAEKGEITVLSENDLGAIVVALRIAPTQEESDLAGHPYLASDFDALADRLER